MSATPSKQNQIVFQISTIKLLNYISNIIILTDRLKNKKLTEHLWSFCEQQKKDFGQFGDEQQKLQANHVHQPVITKSIKIEIYIISLIILRNTDAYTNRETLLNQMFLAATRA